VVDLVHWYGQVRDVWIVDEQIRVCVGLLGLIWFVIGCGDRECLRLKLCWFVVDWSVSGIDCGIGLLIFVTCYVAGVWFFCAGLLMKIMRRFFG
jgi:hypothetical protein